MMSHYGLPYEYDDSWLYGALELSIETLTGTAFEIRVSPNDTIMSIKSKIQSVEGIPVSQQHLLYNLEELDNSASVRDYSIQNGATLKLVLSMRGGPISTKRLPPVDEMAWKELQELMSDSRRDDLFEKLPSGSRVTVLVFRDGDQVNLLRVVENEDGSFSPLSESWNGTSFRNLFSEEDPAESAKRLHENSVTMGKMQELKEKLENLSLQRKEKKNEETGDKSDSESPEDASRRRVRGRPRPEAAEAEGFRQRRRLTSCTKASMAGLSKARKEAQNIIRMQSKLSVLVDAEPGLGGPGSFTLNRAPLPDIRRSPRPDKEEEGNSEEDGFGKDLREKTARSFAIVEEENDVAAAPSICSSQSGMVAVPSDEEVALAYSPISRDRVSTTLGRSRYRVSRYVLDGDERPKTTPGKLDERQGSRGPRFAGTSLLSTFSGLLPRAGSKSQVDVHDRDNKPETLRNQPKKRASTILRNPSFGEGVAVEKLPPPVVKKRLRCSQCHKKLNITNMYTCRCGGLFCSIHRYSEVHTCMFDYKEEGRKLLQQTNPLVAASKLPKI